MVYTGDIYEASTGIMEVVGVDRSKDTVKVLMNNTGVMPYFEGEDGTISFGYSWFERKVIQGDIKLIES